MSRPSLRPRRRLRYELYLLALVMVVPAALVAVFPYDAVGFRPAATRTEPEASCAFVHLTEAEAERALDESRAYWRVDTRGARNLRLELSEADAPEEETGAVLSIVERKRPRLAPPRGPRVPALPPSLAAAAPAALAADVTPAKAADAFPREEMLDVSGLDLKGN